MTSLVAAIPQVSVTLLRPEHELAYERFVVSHPHVLVFYTLRYRDLLCELLGCSPRYAIALRGERIVGVLPLMEKDGLYGRVLNSLPYFGSNGGALTSDVEAEAALVAWYNERASDGAISAATLITNPLRPCATKPSHDFVGERVAHMTTLPADAREDDLLQVVDKSRRWDMRKAERLGTRVAIDNQALSLLQEMHIESMEAKGADVKSPAFFVALPRYFRPATDYDIFVARVEDAPVASLLIFYTGTVADYYMPALPAHSRGGQPMALLLKMAMLHASERGVTRWNWGGSPSTHVTLQRFKAKWGGEPHEYRYWTKVNDPELLSATPQSLRAAYPGFYVVPYNRTHSGEVQSEDH